MAKTKDMFHAHRLSIDYYVNYDHIFGFLAGLLGQTTVSSSGLYFPSPDVPESSKSSDRFFVFFTDEPKHFLNARVMLKSMKSVDIIHSLD